MLHVLNGDATGAVFARSGVPGEVMVWRDILVEGPVAVGDEPTPALEARAVFLAERLGIDPALYRRSAREQATALAGARDHDEVVLWFEQDLFCAVNLWRLLDWLAARATAPRLSLVYPPADSGGLGARTPEDLAELFARRTPVAGPTLATGRRAWAAYASEDPRDTAPLAGGQDAALPFVPGALRCHLGRFPSVANGLNEVETALLAVLRPAACPFAALFREVTRLPDVRRHGMGDTQLAAVARGLGPLLRIAGSDVLHADLAITPLGRAVADGEIDWLSVQPIDTWLGGVRLGAGRPLWRWDAAHGRLAASAPPRSV